MAAALTLARRSTDSAGCAGRVDQVVQRGFPAPRGPSSGRWKTKERQKSARRSQLLRAGGCTVINDLTSTHPALPMANEGPIFASRPTGSLDGAGRGEDRLTG